jgi:hypothetical protein
MERINIMERIDRRLLWIIAATVVIITFIISTPMVSADPVTDAARTVVEKVKTPSDWLSRKALQHGFTISLCATNSMRMYLEGKRFNGEDIGDDYHAQQLALVCGYLLTGYLFYAVLDRESWDWKDKCQLVSGSLCMAREFGEFTYQGTRRGWENAFNNNPDWHRNELPWFQGKATFPFLRDDFISTGRISTPAVHIGCTGLGTYLYGLVR